MNFLIDGGIRLVTYASLGFFGPAAARFSSRARKDGG
jgi:hypothetical protein